VQQSNAITARNDILAGSPLLQRGGKIYRYSDASRLAALKLKDTRGQDAVFRHFFAQLELTVAPKTADGADRELIGTRNGRTGCLTARTIPDSGGKVLSGFTK
jgi:hypothetical protein